MAGVFVTNVGPLNSNRSGKRTGSNSQNVQNGLRRVERGSGDKKQMSDEGKKEQGRKRA